MDKWVIAPEMIADNYREINGLSSKSHQQLQVPLTFPGNGNEERQREMGWINRLEFRVFKVLGRAGLLRFPKFIPQNPLTAHQR